MSTDEYEAIPEDEWKVLATTEITHLTDEEKDYLPHAWDEWIARVRRDAARAERERIGRLENRAASETARANAWRDKHRIMAEKRNAAHRAYQAEREARRGAETRIKAVQDVLDNIDTSNDPALHDGFADILRALDG